MKFIQKMKVKEVRKMKEKLVVMCLKLSVAFEVIAEFIAYPDNRDKERKVSCFGFESEFWW